MNETNTQNLAVFIDFQNVSSNDFNAEKLLYKLKERGRLIIKKAYADWSQFEKNKKEMLQNSIDLIELPMHNNGKNQADIKLVVDALEVAITKDYIQTIVVVSGDSDFSPLISKLREYNKRVIVVGHKGHTSKLLAGYCDELIYYGSLVGDQANESLDLKQAYHLLSRALRMLEDQGVEAHGSRVKVLMKQLDATFDEANYGYSQFKSFLQSAQKQKHVQLQYKDGGDLTVHLPASNSNASGNGNVSPAVEETPAPPKETPKSAKQIPNDVSYVIYWSIKVHQIKPSSPVSLTHIGQTLNNYFDPDWQTRSKHGYSKNKGLKFLLQDLEDAQLIRLQYDDKKNPSMVIVTPEFVTSMADSEEPEAFKQLHQNALAGKLQVTTELDQVYIWAIFAHQSVEAAQAAGRSLTADELRNAVQTAANQHGIQISLRRAMITALKSRTVKAADGIPITQLDDSTPVASVEPTTALMQKIANTLRLVFQRVFQLEIELPTLLEVQQAVRENYNLSPEQLEN